MKWILALLLIASCSTYRFKDFKNLRFESEWAPENSILLKEGKGFVDGVNFNLLKPFYSGKYLGKTYFATVLVTSPAGTGNFRNLAIFTPSTEGLKQVSNIYLGDRVKIKDVEFKGEDLKVTMIVQGEKEPMCCPTQKVVRKYSIKDNFSLIKEK